MAKEKCPIAGCKHTAGSRPGLSAHMRKAHADLWRGTIKATLDPSIEAPAEKKKKRRKYRRRSPGTKGTRRKLPAIRLPLNYCPNCGYHLEPLSLAAGFNG